MNNLYPRWWDKTLTIYNKYEDPETQEVTWTRNVIENCYWKLVGSKTVGTKSFSPKASSKLKTLEDAVIICRIPKDDRFVERSEWFELSDEKRPEFFTIGRGDIIINGDVDDVIDEYEEGIRSTDLILKYTKFDNVMTITEFSIDVGESRVCEHYRVGGI